MCIRDSTHTVRRIVDQHGNLQANPWALDELEEVLVAEPVRRRAGATVGLPGDSSGALWPQEPSQRRLPMRRDA